MRRAIFIVAIFGLSACANASSDLPWKVSFACESAANEAERVRTRIHEQACDGRVRYESTASRGRQEEAPTPPRLEPGRYAFEATATTASDEVVAVGCEVVDLPRDGSVEIILLPVREEVCADELDGSLPDRAAPPPLNDGGERGDAAVTESDADTSPADAAGPEAGDADTDTGPPPAPDRDQDGVPDADDIAPDDPWVCGDSDADGCDDCGGLGVFDPAQDGPDANEDGACDCAIHVDDNAPNNNGDGLSWETAKQNLQSGIDRASGDGCEVWVAEGRYFVFGGAGVANALQMRDRIGVYGGFAGSERVRSQRLPETRISVIDGRASAGGTGHVYHLVKGADAAVLDGFLLTEGGSGFESPPQCVGDACRGAAVFVEGDDFILRQVRFAGNRATVSGGGVYVRSGSVLIEDAQFEGNHAARGGALRLNNASATLRRVRFERNVAAQDGGGLYADGTSELQVENAVFWSNSAEGRGGASFSQGLTRVTFRNASFVANAGVEGAGLAVIGSAAAVLHNSVLWGHALEDWFRDGTIDSTLEFHACLVEGPTAGADRVLRAVSGDPRFVDEAGGDLHLRSGSACIDAADQDAQTPATDIEGRARFDDPETVNTGTGTGIVDVGAHEFVR